MWGKKSVRSRRVVKINCSLKILSCFFLIFTQWKIATDFDTFVKKADKNLLHSKIFQNVIEKEKKYTQKKIHNQVALDPDLGYSIRNQNFAFRNICCDG